MDDDDVLIVVIGDDQSDEPKAEPTEICASIQVKDEPLDEFDVMELIETATKYGRPVILKMDEDTYKSPENTDTTFQIAIQNIKDELSDINEEDNDESNKVIDEDYVPEEDYIPDEGNPLEYKNDDNEDDYKPASDDESDDESWSDSSVKDRPRTRGKMLSPSRQKSFIEDLRQQYPELKKNQNALIKSLVEIMRNNKPPAPPKDYYYMNDIMYECAKCGAFTNCIPAATRHYQEKHGPRYLVCYACGVDFRSKTNLYKHEKRCNAPDAIIVLRARALVLGRKGRGRPFLPDPSTVPLLTSKNKQYSCYECSATFTTKSNLVSHENMHNGVRPYCCDKCPRAYTSSSALARHLQSHSNQTFICDHCNNSYNLRSALVAHLNVHRTVPRFACAVCPQRYATKNALNHHVRRVHLNLPMPFACQVCPKRYPRMSILGDHMKKKHGLTLMTRKMFFKAMPTMTESQLQQAKVIFKKQGPLINLSSNMNSYLQS